MNLCMEGVNSGWHGVFPLNVLSQAFDSSFNTLFILILDRRNSSFLRHTSSFQSIQRFVMVPGFSLVW